MNPAIRSYNNSLSVSEKDICDLLATEMDLHLPEAENKIWHGQPVWFLDGNPVTGYSKRKTCVQLLFWSGDSFEEPELQKTGKFKAAEFRITSIEQISTDDLKRWLKKSREIQWDYKNIVKRKGKLDRLK